MKLNTLSNLLPLALLFTSSSALPTAEPSTSKHITRTLGVDALNAPELVERYGQSTADNLISHTQPIDESALQKRDYERIVLCGGVQEAIQCGGASMGFGQCVSTYTLRILDDSQRVGIFNNPKSYIYGKAVDGYGVDPCGKNYYGGVEGDNQDGISINCSRPWGDARDGDNIAYAVKASGGKTSMFYCRKVGMVGGDRNWCYYRTNGLLTFKHKRDFECSPYF